jgi:hypothetical protein
MYYYPTLLFTGFNCALFIPFQVRLETSKYHFHIAIRRNRVEPLKVSLFTVIPVSSKILADYPISRIAMLTLPSNAL